MPMMKFARRSGTPAMRYSSRSIVAIAFNASVYLQSALGGKGIMMLVFTRRLGESIVIEDPKASGPVEIKVISVRGSRVRLGIIGPDSVQADRQEVAVAKRFDARRPPEGTCDDRAGSATIIPQTGVA